jgi:hypothetical protein
VIDTLAPLIKKFLPFAKEKMGFKLPPRLFLRGDTKNAQNPLGKTAYYDPGAKSITLYITGRHPKDVMRSLSHELVHHTQNCNGQFEDIGEMGEGYAQSDEHLREMEREAYELGNMCFRDWEDGLKETIYYEHLQKGENTMSLEDWKNKEISQLLSEAWGFKFNTLQEFDEFNGDGEITEQEEEIDEGAYGSRQGGDRAKQQCEKQGKKMVAGKCVEVQEEGGTAKRGENAAKGTERGMNLDDRIHEEEEEDGAEELEEQCPAEEEEEVVEEDTTSRMAGLRKTRGEVEPEEEEETEDLKEAIKTLLTKYLKG